MTIVTKMYAEDINIPYENVKHIFSKIIFFLAIIFYFVVDESKFSYRILNFPICGAKRKLEVIHTFL